MFIWRAALVTWVWFLKLFLKVFPTFSKNWKIRKRGKKYWEKMVQSRKPLVPWLAAAKGFWDPLRRCWNDEVGRMSAYISHRNQRLAIRKALKQRALHVPKAENDKSHQSCTCPLKIVLNTKWTAHSLEKEQSDPMATISRQIVYH